MQSLAHSKQFCKFRTARHHKHHRLNTTATDAAITMYTLSLHFLQRVILRVVGL